MVYVYYYDTLLFLKRTPIEDPLNFCYHERMNTQPLSEQIFEIFTTEGFSAVQKWWRQNWWRNLDRKYNKAHFKHLAIFVLKKENIQQPINHSIEQWQQILRFSARHAGKEIVSHCLFEAAATNKKWAVDALINHIPSKQVVEILNCAADYAQWEIVDHLYPLVDKDPANDGLKMAIVHKNKQRVESYLTLATPEQKRKAFFYAVGRNNTFCGDLIFDQLSLSDRINSVCLALHCGSDTSIQWLCERMPTDQLLAALEYNKTNKALKFKNQWDFVFSSHLADQEGELRHQKTHDTLQNILTKNILAKAVKEVEHAPASNKRKM